MKLGIIGFGNMANAIYENAKENLSGCYIYDTDQAKKTLIKQNPKQTFTNISEIFTFCDVILFAIKPQQLNNVLSLCPKKTNSLIVSILAGSKISHFQNHFNSPTPIIRVMPNTPIRVQKGCVVYAPNQFCSANHITNLKCLFANSSYMTELKEQYFDTITALSGSGPAFFYKIVDAMAQEAQKNGLNQSEAIRLLAHTMIGAGYMLQKQNPDTLIQEVSSPNGTTQAGLSIFDQLHIDESLQQVIKASINRSIQLGKK